MTTRARLLCLSLVLSLAILPAFPAAAQDAAPPPAPAKTSDGAAKKKQDPASKKEASKKKSSKDSKSKDSKPKDSKSDKPGRKSAQPKAEGPDLGADAFKGLAWGTPLNQVPNLSLREKQGKMAYYVRLGDDMEVMGVMMREIVYVFCQGKLSGALTRYDGEVNHLVLLARLREAYGTPLETPPNFSGDRSWRFDAGETSMVMEYSPKGGTGAVGWMSQGVLAPCKQ